MMDRFNEIPKYLSILHRNREKNPEIQMEPEKTTDRQSIPEQK